MQVTQSILPFYVGFNSNTSEDVHETYEDITVHINTLQSLRKVNLTHRTKLKISEDL